MTLACAAREQIDAPSTTPLLPTNLDMGVLFERSQDAVIVARLSTHEIALWNPAAERLFGYSAAEAIGQSIEMLMPGAVAGLHRAAVNRYVQTGRGLMMNAAAPVEVPAVSRDGTDLRVQISLSELTNARGERFALAIMRDAGHNREIELMRVETDRWRRTSYVLLWALASATCDIPTAAAA